MEKERLGSIYGGNRVASIRNALTGRTSATDAAPISVKTFPNILSHLLLPPLLQPAPYYPSFHTPHHKWSLSGIEPATSRHRTPDVRSLRREEEREVHPLQQEMIVPSYPKIHFNVTIKRSSATGSATGSVLTMEGCHTSGSRTCHSTLNSEQAVGP